MAAGLPLPKQIWAHGWLLMDSAKMSKSLGNVVRPRPIVHVLGMDALRYYLLRETVFGQDGNFSYDALVQRYNSDLANGLGNLASRTAAMIEKNSGGRIPKPAALPTAGHRLGHASAGRDRRSYGAVRQSGILSRTGAALVADRRDGQIPYDRTSVVARRE